METHSDESAMNTRDLSLLLELLFTQVLYNGGYPALMEVVSRFVRAFLLLGTRRASSSTVETVVWFNSFDYFCKSSE